MHASVGTLDEVDTRVVECAAQPAFSTDAQEPDGDPFDDSDVPQPQMIVTHFLSLPVCPPTRCFCCLTRLVRPLQIRNPGVVSKLGNAIQYIREKHPITGP